MSLLNPFKPRNNILDEIYAITKEEDIEEDSIGVEYLRKRCIECKAITTHKHIIYYILDDKGLHEIYRCEECKFVTIKKEGMFKEEE